MPESGSHQNKYFNPAATVTAVIVRQVAGEIQVLLTLRAIEPFQNKWCLPGGHIDKFERSYDAIIREIREETGLNFEGEHFATFDEIFADLDIHNVVSAFAGTGKGELRPQLSEVSELRWVPLRTARDMDLAFDHNRVLDAFLLWYDAKNEPNKRPGLSEE